jgi:hypothetical protein
LPSSLCGRSYARLRFVFGTVVDLLVGDKPLDLAAALLAVAQVLPLEEEEMMATIDQPNPAVVKKIQTLAQIAADLR